MNIKELSRAYAADTVSARRYLHAHPELGTREFATTEYICRQLEAFGVQVQRFEDITGCVGVIEGAAPGKTVMLRADIDALPIQEGDKTSSYCSVNDGVMHACGHDCHTAMLLTAARILMEKRGEFKGRVKLLFQMGEELGRMSEKYVERGVLDDVDAVFGMHIWNNLDAGKANFVTGERMACSDRFTVNISGEAAHGSTPFLGKDALVAAAATVMALQTIVSRGNDPRDALVITVGKMNGGDAVNVLADRTELVGTCRAFNRSLRERLPQLIKETAERAAAAYGCRAECTYYFGPDPVINEHEELVELAAAAAEEQLGAAYHQDLPKMLGAEDFSVFMSRVPGVYGYLGGRNKAKGLTVGHHHPLFDTDEDVLQHGAGIYAGFAVKYLMRK